MRLSSCISRVILHGIYTANKYVRLVTDLVYQEKNTLYYVELRCTLHKSGTYCVVKDD